MDLPYLQRSTLCHPLPCRYRTYRIATFPINQGQP
jgi:hypothetical protein